MPRPQPLTILPHNSCRTCLTTNHMGFNMLWAYINWEMPHWVCCLSVAVKLHHCKCYYDNSFNDNEIPPLAIHLYYMYSYMAIVRVHNLYNGDRVSNVCIPSTTWSAWNFPHTSVYSQHKLTPGKIATKVLMIKDLINDTQFKPVFSQGILTEWITKLCGFKHKGILIFAIKR